MTQTQDPLVAAWARLTLSSRKALPIIYQRQVAECWLACLAMVACYHGYRTDLVALRQRIVVSSRGGTFRDIAELATGLGLKSRAVRLEVGQLKLLALPAILHWNFDHFVVLKRVTKRGVVIHDPALGSRLVRHADVSREFTGVAMEIWPSENFARSSSYQSASWKQLLGRPKGLTALTIQLLVIGFVLQLLMLLTPVVTQWSIDNVVSTGDLRMLTTAAVVLGLIIATRTVFEAARSVTVAHAITLFSVRWRSTIVDHLAKLPLAWFGQRQTGTIASNFNATETIVRTINDSILNSVLDGLMSVVTLLLMFEYSKVLALITFGGAFGYALLRGSLSDPLRRQTQDQVAATARESAHLIETIRCIRTVKILARERERHQEWLNVAVETANAKASLVKFTAVMKMASSAIGGVEQVAVFWVGMYEAIHGRMTIGAIVAFFAFRQQFYDRVSSLVDTCIDLKLLRVHGDRVGDIVTAEADFDNQTEDTRRLGSLGGDITCTAVSFRYGSNQPYILKALQVVIVEGQSVAITGSSGCGKSTFISLLLGLQQPTEGEISISGVALNSLGRAELRRHIGAVTQDDVLFMGSILQNIASFDPFIDVEHAMHCARLMQIDADILRLPMGYNSVVAEIGDTLSGGQRQRLCLARAIYRKPRILIMDEATSNLDVDTERLVSAAIKSLGMTRIIIAHRPETIRSADRIVRLDGGRIVEDTADLLVDQVAE